MNTQQDYAYKLGCGRLVMQRGAISLAGEEARMWGTKAMVIGGPHTLPLVQDALLQSLEKSNCSARCIIYQGPCAEETAKKYAQQCCAHGENLIIGVGGGRIMDFAKIIAEISCLPVMCIPTSGATCAAYTPLSVVYTLEGKCRSSWYLRHAVSCVLIDLDILSHQPQRLAAAGMLDSAAKHFEIAWHITHGHVESIEEKVASCLAEQLYIALKARTPSNVDLSFLTIVQTGLISNITRGYYQSALGHAFYEAIRTSWTKESAGALHGEIVALGLVLQEEFLGNSTHVDELLSWMKNLGMPCSMNDFGIKASNEELIDFAAQHFFAPFVSQDARNRYIQLLQEVQ